MIAENNTPKVSTSEMTKANEQQEKPSLIKRIEEKCIEHLFITVLIGGAFIFILLPMVLPIAWTQISPSFTESDMTGRWISVFMSLIFTVFVTQGLLKHQSKSQKQERLGELAYQFEGRKGELEIQFKQRKREKEYEEKLEIYKDYLKLLGKIIGDEKLKRDEEVELRVMTASIAMHTSADRMKGICANVRDVVLSMCDKKNGDIMARFMQELTYGEDEKVSDKRVRSDALLTNLMSISNYFREELYEDAHQDKSLIESMKKDFAKLFELANPGASDDSDQDDIDNGKNVAESAQAEAMEEESAVMIHPNWVLKLGTDSTWKKLSLEPKGDKKWGEIYIRPWGDRCAMVMRYLDEEGEPVKAFADEMKYWGFYRSNLRTVYGEWRNTLDDDQWCKKYDAQKLLSNGTYSYSKEIKSDEFLTRYKEDSFFRSHLENMLKNFVKYMEQYRRRCSWKELLSEYESSSNNLNIYPHITTLWCDYSTSAEDGFVRLSLNEETQKDEKNEKILAHVLISRYNADAAFEQLLDALPGTKLNTKPKSELMQEVNEKGHVRVASFDYIMCEDNKTINEEQTAGKAKAIFEEWNTLLKTVR